MTGTVPRPDYLRQCTYRQVSFISERYLWNCMVSFVVTHLTPQQHWLLSSCTVWSTAKAGKDQLRWQQRWLHVWRGEILRPDVFRPNQGLQTLSKTTWATTQQIEGRTSCVMWLFRNVTLYQIKRCFVNTLLYYYWQTVFRAGWNGFDGRIRPAGRSLQSPGLNCRSIWSHCFKFGRKGEGAKKREKKTSWTYLHYGTQTWRERMQKSQNRVGTFRHGRLQRAMRERLEADQLRNFLPHTQQPAITTACVMWERDVFISCRGGSGRNVGGRSDNFVVF